MNLEQLENVTVYILESLRPGDKKTGENLRDALRQYWLDEKGKCFFCEYHVVPNKSSLLKQLQYIENQVEKENKIPILQLECHGCKQGIQLSSNEIINWSELFNSIRPINIVSHNLLYLNLSMCNGDAVISYIDPEHRASFRAVTGPLGEVYPDKLEELWVSFYKEYSSAIQLDCGFSKLAQRVGLIYYNQDFIFDVYYDLANKDPELFVHLRNREMAAMYKNEGPLAMNPEIYRKFAAKKQAEIKEKYKSHFCFEELDT